MQNNFLWLGHLDTFAVIARLHKMAPHTWKGVPERGEHNNPMIGLGASVLLRGHENITHENWLDDLPVKDLPDLEAWPSMQTLLSDARAIIMSNPLGRHHLTGEPARAMLSRLDPGSTIFWHEDDGPYHAKTLRFHLALLTNPGCQLHAGPESAHLPAGSLWFFNNKVRHSAANFGQFFRIHLVFEMRRKED